MKFTKNILFVVALLISLGASAQLLERESVQSRIVSGTRPVQGDFGFFIGPSLIEINEIFDEDVSVRGFPLMGFKYYVTDNIEARLQTQIYSTSTEYQGTLVNALGQEDNINKESFYRFMPSAQYHFSSTNFLDTYAGIGVIVGSEVEETLTTEKVNLTGDYVAKRARQKAFILGYNINFGMQAFVADLPISIGLEASIRSEKKSGLEFEGTTQTSVGGIVNTQTYFTREADGALQFDSLDASESEVGADFRFVFTYYFRK